ncbi:MAG TPA: LysR family transcriptional regulator [Nocardioides bacterium]|uniref:LysR family transcriptional regulator n=1 Tax=uncultured Nocardioides sp. TaxID=198441 RepID=UPI000EDD02EC|nr:LysR family transcriptional regulator [uncultured Nocardioides sp.]HCB07775.1 LysR family transcriptional regulator [Nocardioides sp.]
MDPRRLLIFRAVARAGSISAAARDLGWTQPAVSQHLRALERSAGCALLIRGAGGVELTEPGRMLLARADALAVQLHMAEEELAELTALRRGRVRLAAYPSAAATLVPRAIAGLRARHPDVDVELTEAEPPEALALLGTGDADLALVFAYDDDAPAEGPGLTWRPLGDEPVALVVAPEHPVARRRRLTLADLADEPWIVGCERCRAHAVRVCAEAGFEPTVRHVSDDYVVVQNLVAVGLGVTLLPRSALEAHPHPGVRVREHPSFGTRTFGIVHREGADQVPATAALIRELSG